MTRLSSSGPEPFDACPDGGRCWHACPGTDKDGDKGLPCFRVLHAQPYTGTYPDDPDDGWPEDLFEQHAEAQGPPTPGPCANCGKDPAEGFASVTVGGVQRWYCHGDDGPSCYVGAPMQPGQEGR